MPSGYSVCYEGGKGVGLPRLLALLPPAAGDLLRAQENKPMPYTNLAGTFSSWCSELTTEESASSNGSSTVRVNSVKDVFGLSYGAPGPGPGRDGVLARVQSEPPGRGVNASRNEPAPSSRSSIYRGLRDAVTSAPCQRTSKASSLDTHAATQKASGRQSGRGSGTSSARLTADSDATEGETAVVPTTSGCWRTRDLLGVRASSEHASYNRGAPPQM